MLAKIIRKAIIFLFAYVVIMVGIFVIQFRNDSVISENFGNLHLILNSLEANGEKVGLQNKWTITYNGITFSASDEKPVMMLLKDTKLPISLVFWKKQSSLEFLLNFTNDIDVRIILSDNSSNASLNVSVTMPPEVDFIEIPYSTNKKSSFSLNASKINADSIMISRKDAIASYSYVDKNRSFSYEVAKNSEYANESAYNSVLESYKKKLISLFEQNLNDSANLAEQEAVSYIAAMAENGKYNEAIEKIPQNFKRGYVKSFISSPYFDNLSVTNEELLKQFSICAEKIKKTSSDGILDALNEKNLSDYMRLHPASTQIKQFLQNLATLKSENITILHATKILSLYFELYKNSRVFADELLPVLPECTKKIENACSLDNDKITISENGILLSVVNAVAIGDAIYQYGKISGNGDIEECGELIIYSYLSENASFDLKTLAEIYPIVVHSNKYYPHLEILSFENGKAVWAWTCAQKLVYKNDNAGTVTLSIDFPISSTHYIILNGISDFKTIYIYNMIFRTDYRFETYNSSGYVYQPKTNTLLLKSRHREKTETIRMLSFSVSPEQTENENSTDVSLENF